MAKKPSLSPSGIALRVRQAESAIQFSLEAAPPAQRAAVAEHMGALREDLLRLVTGGPPPPPSTAMVPGETRTVETAKFLQAVVKTRQASKKKR